jgi:phosphate/sulfate permease
VSPWLDWHLQRMLKGIDQGCSVIEALDTGLIDSDIWWYFVDMVCTLGLDTALERTGERLASKSLHSIHKQAIFLRWILLFCALAIVLGVLFWHFQVFDELRYALTIHYAH